MIRAIFFDFDGVIVESVGLKTEAFAKLFEHEGGESVKNIVAYHLENAGVSRFDKFKYIYREILKRPLDESEFRRLCERFAVLVVNGVVNAPYVPGAREFLEHFAERYKCYVVSATPHEEILDIIDRRALKVFFAGVYGAPNKKEDVIRDTLIAEGIRPEDALSIGDALSDFNAARANKVRFIARIKDNEALFEDIQCFKIKDLTELGPLIDTMERLTVKGRIIQQLLSREVCL